jgi:hypothetical protein
MAQGIDQARPKEKIELAHRHRFDFQKETVSLPDIVR